MKRFNLIILFFLLVSSVVLCAPGDITAPLTPTSIGALSSSGTAPNTFYVPWSQLLNIPYYISTIAGATDYNSYFMGIGKAYTSGTSDNALSLGNIVASSYLTSSSAISLYQPIGSYFLTTGTLSYTQVYGLSTVAHSSNYSDLSGNPTNLNQFTNGPGYQTLTGTVATITGTIPSTQVSGIVTTIAGATDNSTYFTGTSARMALSLSGTITNTQVTGLGTSSTHDTSDFATASQGAEADTALQSITAGTAITTSTLSKNVTVNFVNPGYITSSGTSLLISGTIPSSQVSGLAAVATSGSYGSLSGVPTNLNQFTNGPGYQTLTGTVALITGTIPASQVTGVTATIAGATDYASYFMGVGKSYTSGTSDYALLSGTALLITGTIPNTQVSGLGSAALVSTTTFATSAQGSEADTALQGITAGTAITTSTAGKNVTVNFVNPGYQTTSGTVTMITGTIAGATQVSGTVSHASTALTGGLSGLKLVVQDNIGYAVTDDNDIYVNAIYAYIAYSAYYGGVTGCTLAVNYSGYVYDDNLLALNAWYADSASYAYYADSASYANSANYAAYASYASQSFTGFFGDYGYTLNGSNGDFLQSNGSGSGLTGTGSTLHIPWTNILSAPSFITSSGTSAATTGTIAGATQVSGTVPVSSNSLSLGGVSASSYLLSSSASTLYQLVSATNAQTQFTAPAPVFAATSATFPYAVAGANNVETQVLVDARAGINHATTGIMAASGTLLATTNFYVVTATGNTTLVLPSTTSVGAGVQTIRILNQGNGTVAGTVTVSGSGSETLNGSSTYTITNSPGQAASFTADSTNTNWFVTTNTLAYNWIDATGNWSDTTKWMNGYAANANHALATFPITTGTITLNQPVTLGRVTSSGGSPLFTGGTLTLQNNGASSVITTISGTASIASIISGSANLTKSGTGILVDTGSNTYTGGTTVTSGGLVTGINNKSLGTGTCTVSNGGQLVLSGGTYANFLNISGTGYIGATYPVAVYSSTTSYSTGVVTLSSSASLGVVNGISQYYFGIITGTGDLHFGFVGGAGTTQLVASNIYVGNTYVDYGTLQIGSNSGTTSSVGTGNIVVATGANLASDLGGSAVFYKQVSGGGNFIATGNASGTLTMTATNTYTGSTSVNRGTLQAGLSSNVTGGPFGVNSQLITVNTSGYNVDINNYNVSIGSLLGGGTAGGNVTLGTGTLTLGGDGTSPIYAGAITGAGDVVKVGPGSQILTGTSTYTGNTRINNGGYQIGNNNALGAIGTGLITGSSTGHLAMARSDNTTFSNNMSGSVQFWKYYPSTCTLTGTSTSTGLIGVYGGTISVSSPSNAGTMSLQLGNAALACGFIWTGATSSTLSNNLQFNGTTGPITLTQSGSGNVLFSGGISNTGSGAKTLILNGIGSGNASIKNPIIDYNSSNPLTLQKQDYGVWILNGTSTYTGGTTISSGTLAVGSANALGTGTCTIANSTGSTLQTGTSAISTTALIIPGGLVCGGLLSQISVTTNGTTTTGTISVTGTTALGGCKINVINTLSVGVYTIITSTGTMSGTVPVLGTNSSGRTITFAQVGNNLVMTAT